MTMVMMYSYVIGEDIPHLGCSDDLRSGMTASCLAIHAISIHKSQELPYDAILLLLAITLTNIDIAQ